MMFLNPNRPGLPGITVKAQRQQQQQQTVGCGLWALTDHGIHGTQRHIEPEGSLPNLSINAKLQRQLSCLIHPEVVRINAPALLTSVFPDCLYIKLCNLFFYDFQQAWIFLWVVGTLDEANRTA